MSTRVRNWCFTYNNYTDENVEVIKAWVCKYLIFGKEPAPTTGTKHLQGYVAFDSQTTLSALKKKYPYISHWEIAGGDAQQNSDYCSKGEQSKQEWEEHKTSGPNYGLNADVFEKGVKPQSPKEIGIGEKRRWEDAYKAVEENRLEDVPKDILCTRLKNVQYAVDQVRISKRNIQTLEGEFEHEWYYGPPGTGKSRKARTENPDAYIKDPTNKWWDGYKGQDVVIIDDFDKYCIAQSSNMKRWTDRYPFQAETKGGSLGPIRPRKIITTSNQNMDEIWNDPTDHLAQAMKRRHKVTYFPAMFTGPDPPSPDRFTSLPSRFN